MRCRFPDCTAEAWHPLERGKPAPHPSWIRCREHRAQNDATDMVLCWAQEYAVACIVYYDELGEPTMPDAEFDDLCQALLGLKAWTQIPWLEEGMLRAGSGYDLGKFPADLHDAAEHWRQRK